MTYTPGVASATVTAAYDGDSGYAASNGSVLLKVGSRSTKTVLSCDQTIIAIGQSTTCTATVTDISPGAQSLPAGTVSFTGNKTDAFAGTPCTLDAVGASSASCQTTYTPHAGPDKHAITAHYKGGGTHMGSTGHAALTITAQQSS